MTKALRHSQLFHLLSQPGLLQAEDEASWRAPHRQQEPSEGDVAAFLLRAEESWGGPAVRSVRR